MSTLARTLADQAVETLVVVGEGSPEALGVLTKQSVALAFMARYGANAEAR